MLEAGDYQALTRTPYTPLGFRPGHARILPGVEPPCEWVDKPDCNYADRNK